MKQYLSQTWYDPRIEIRRSSMSGYGMFARQPIREGEPDCRQHITGNDWKQKDVQEKYCHHFSPFIDRRIEALHT